MKSICTLVAASLCAGLLTACGGQGATPGATAERSSPANIAAAKASADGPTLYISEGGGVAVFAGGGASFLRKIRPKAGPIATDQKGRLYIANLAAVAVYENRGAKLAWKVPTK